MDTDILENHKTASYTGPFCYVSIAGQYRDKFCG